MGALHSKKIEQISTGHNARLEHDHIIAAVAANNKLQRKLMLKQAKKHFAQTSYGGAGMAGQPVYQNPLMYYPTNSQQLEDSDSIIYGTEDPAEAMFYNSCQSLYESNPRGGAGMGGSEYKINNNIMQSSCHAEYPDDYIYSSPTSQALHTCDNDGLKTSSSTSFLNHPIYLPHHQTSSEQPLLGAQNNHNQHIYRQSRHQHHHHLHPHHHHPNHSHNYNHHHQTHEPKKFTSPPPGVAAPVTPLPPSSYMQQPSHKEQNYTVYAARGSATMLNQQQQQQQHPQQKRRTKRGMKKSNTQAGARPQSRQPQLQQQQRRQLERLATTGSDNKLEESFTNSIEGGGGSQQQPELKKGEPKFIEHYNNSNQAHDTTITSETLEKVEVEREVVDKPNSSGRSRSSTSGSSSASQQRQTVEQERQASKQAAVVPGERQSQDRLLEDKRNVRQSSSSTASLSAYNNNNNTNLYNNHDDDDDYDYDEYNDSNVAIGNSTTTTTNASGSSNPGGGTGTNAGFAVAKTSAALRQQRSLSETPESVVETKGLAEAAAEAGVEVEARFEQRQQETKKRPLLVEENSTTTTTTREISQNQYHISKNNNIHPNTSSSSSQYSSQSSRSTSSDQLVERQQEQPLHSAKESTQDKSIGRDFNNKQQYKKPTTTTTTTIIMSNQEQGLAFKQEQREKLNLIGLLPAAIQDQELQVKAVMNFIENCCQDELSRYVYLRNLKDFNERLFYAAMSKNVKKLMPLVYTPTVGLACQKFSHIYMRPRGIFITINDLGRIPKLLANWPVKDVRVIVVTDGERILGLGDLGANGMGISIGKLSLYTALAGIPPQNVLPVCIDVGTNNEANLKDPFYIGLKQERVRGSKYDQLIDEFMQAVVERWGRSCLIQFEDFANSTAFNLLQRYRQSYCTFNDDIQGTASVCLSGLISAAKLIGRRLSDSKFLFYGAGEANLGTVNLLIMAMKEEGATDEEAKNTIWLIDSKGLVVNSRTDLSSHKRHYAREEPQIRELEDIIEHVKPTAIIGASAQGGAFNERICRKMAQFNERPIIFALSNPTSKAECTADQAYTWTEGRCVFASGSPFDPVTYNGKTYITGQGNNAYIFPGVGLAAIAAHLHTVPEELFLVAARALSDQLTEADSSVGLVYPRLDNIQEVTLTIATRVLEHTYAERLATYRPEPENKKEFLRSIQYNPSYSAEQSTSINNNGISSALGQMSLAGSKIIDAAKEALKVNSH